MPMNIKKLDVYKREQIICCEVRFLYKEICRSMMQNSYANGNFETMPERAWPLSAVQKI